MGKQNNCSDDERKNMFKWFDATRAKEFAHLLADFLIENMPIEQSVKKDKLLKKRSEVFANLLWKIEEFKKNNKLNLYQKAQLGNTLKWRLIEAEFESDFASEITHLVLTSL